LAPQMVSVFMTTGGSTRQAQGEAPILTSGHGWVVLNKPARLASHAGPRGGASVEDFFPQLSRRKDGPWLAHRLDADTAGCLLIALRKSVLVAAQAAFAAGKAGKVYWAVVAGGPAQDGGVIEAPLLRVSDKTGWQMVPDARGDRAVTDWRVLGRAAGMAWLELRPRTGRTHQLRVHCKLLGAPILGDPIYGSSPLAGHSLHLLARELNLPLTVDTSIAAVAPPPDHMTAALTACGWTT